MDYYYTKYKNNSYTTTAYFADLLEFEEAEEKGKKYCEENGLEYLGTFKRDKEDY